ncbi:hypothetical protein Q3G72_028426 [Acer saccharum]|nr:hypothetical protein Q3G72_028426 [Acer saccharum]
MHLLEVLPDPSTLLLETAVLSSSFDSFSALEKLSGQIPIVISGMTRLVTLDLSTESFLGSPLLTLENPNLRALVQNLRPINSSLASLRSISVILLDQNNLSSPVPEFWLNSQI